MSPITNGKLPGLSFIIINVPIRYVTDGAAAGSVQLDRYGNHLGPGLADGFTVGDAPGSTVSGAVQDNGDGSYEVTVIWDPASGNPPGVIVEQPGRPSLVITEPAQPGEKKRGCLLVLLLALLVLILWFKKRR